MSISPDRALRALLALLAAALLAFGAAACGSDDDGGSSGGGGSDAADTSESEPLSKNDYLKEVNTAQTDFAGEAGKLNLANPSSPKGFKKSLDQLVGLIDKLTERLDAVEPPETVASQHDDLVSQLTAYGDAIEEEKGGLTSGNNKEVADAAGKIQKASTTFSTDFSATINEVNKRLK
jgi:hypothetical protein